MLQITPSIRALPELSGAVVKSRIQPCEALTRLGKPAATSQHNTKRTTSAVATATPNAMKSRDMDRGGIGKLVMANPLHAFSLLSNGGQRIALDQRARSGRSYLQKF